MWRWTLIDTGILAILPVLTVAVGATVAARRARLGRGDGDGGDSREGQGRPSPHRFGFPTVKVPVFTRAMPTFWTLPAPSVARTQTRQVPGARPLPTGSDQLPPAERAFT